jgi:outer membrane protein OmpA-like peptidoglycan-associated protein
LSVNLFNKNLTAVAMASLLLCDAAPRAAAEGYPAPQESAAAIGVIGAGVVVGTVALIDVFHRKHTIRGCVTEGADGLQIVDEATQNTYLLRGKEDLVQPGSDAAILGRKKHKRHELYFVVKKVRADYGPCGQSPAMLAVAAPAPTPAPAPSSLQRRPAGGNVEASINATGSAALYGVEFDTSSAQLRDDSQPMLEKAKAVIDKRPNSHWVIAGYTDDRGSTGVNQRLSEARANSVRDWLVNHGIAADRLEARGYGASHFVSDNGDDEGRAKNRRVELQLVE